MKELSVINVLNRKDPERLAGGHLTMKVWFEADRRIRQLRDHISRAFRKAAKKDGGQ